MEIMGARRNQPLIIKFSGGLTAQMLALMSAIYLSKKLNRPFKMRYFPYSTGTYWPLGIGPLLEDSELEGIRETRGISYSVTLNPGDYIADFPLRRKGLSYEGLLQVIHKLHLDAALRWLRSEYVIGGKISRLRSVPSRATSISGNFPPILDDIVMSELSRRVNRAQLPNPFEAKRLDKSVVIHYRLGDMRKMPSRNVEYGGHGVVDPAVFKEIVESNKIELQDSCIKVVSDEPRIATKLLEEVGFKDVEDLSTGNVWRDLETIASANIFIGSSSQFSAFGAILCAKNGGLVILPASNYGVGVSKSDMGVEEFSFFNYRYLKANHWIFEA